MSVVQNCGLPVAGASLMTETDIPWRDR